MKAQYNAGVSALPQIYSQEAELGNLEYDLLTAENSHFTSKASLLILMGLAPDLDVNFDVNSIPATVTEKEVESFYNNHKDQNDLVRKALNNRYDIKSYDFSENAAKAAKKAAEGNYYPNISASSGWSWANTEVNEFSTRGNFALGLNLSVPIFNNFRTDQQVQNAELQFKQAEIEKQRLENQVRNEVKTALLSLEITQKQLIVSDKSYESSRRNNESIKERYKVGAASVLELQTSNTQFINSQLNKVNAVYNYFKAKKELLNAIGVEQ
ncbi:MAG: TolC family protein [Candidatus Kapaibacterium sp.]